MSTYQSAYTFFSRKPFKSKELNSTSEILIAHGKGNMNLYALLMLLKIQCSTKMETYVKVKKLKS